MNLISCSTKTTNLPNIIIILAGDMGYGDVQAFNPMTRKNSGGKKVDETIVHIIGGVKPEGNAEDSYRFAALIFREKENGNRPPMIHHSGGKGMFVIRKGKWKMVRKTRGKINFRRELKRSLFLLLQALSSYAKHLECLLNYPYLFF